MRYSSEELEIVILKIHVQYALRNRVMSGTNTFYAAGMPMKS